MEIGSLFARIGADTTAYDAAMSRVRNSMRESGGTLGQLGASAAHAGGLITRSLTLPVVGLAAAALKSAGDFDATMKLLQVATHATGDQFKEMQAKAIALGADIHLPGTSATDAAQAMLELGKSGLTAQQSMQAVRGVLVASAAAGETNAQAADDVAGALSAFSLKAKEAGQVANILAGGANNARTDMQGVSLALAATGQSAHAAHLSLAQTVAAIAEVNNAGIPAADAGIALKVMFQSLTPQTKKAQAAMKELGVSTYDAHGKMRPFPQIIEQFRSGMGKLTEAQRNQALQTIFGTHAINAARIIFNDGAKGLDKMTGAVSKQGQAAKMAAAANSGIKGAIDGLISTGQTLLVLFGNAIGPAFQKLAGWVQQGIAAFERLSGPVKTAIGAVIGTLALLGPALLAVGAIITFMLSPVMLVAAALAVLVGAFVYLYQTSPQVRAWANEAKTWLGDHIPAAINAAKNAFQTLVGAVRAALPEVASIVRSVIGSQVVQFVVQQFGVMVSGVEQHWSEIKATIVAAIGLIRSAIQGGMAAVKAVWDWAPFQTLVQATWSVIKTVIQAAIKVVGDLIGAGMAVIRGDWGQAWSYLKAAVSTALSAVGSVVKTSLSALATVALALATAAGKAIADGVKKAAEFLAGLAGALLGIIGSAISSVASWALGAAESIGRNIAQGAINGIKSMAGSIAGAAKGVGSSIVGGISGALGINSPSKVTMALGKFTSEGFLIGFLDGTRQIPAAAAKSAQDLLNAWKTRIDGVKTTLATSFDQLASDAMSAFDARTQQKLDQVAAHFDKLKTHAQAVFDQIKNGADVALAASNTSIDQANQQLTPAEAALQQAQTQHDEQQRQQAISDARQQLAAAQTGGDPAQILQAQRQLDDALYQEHIASLQQQAALERAAADAKAQQAKDAAQKTHDDAVAAAQATLDQQQASYDAQLKKADLNLQAQRDLQKRHLQAMLDSLKASLAQHPTEWAKVHGQIMRMFADSFGPDYKTAGQNLGLAFATGLKESFSHVGNVVNDLAAMIARYLKLHSPSETGPLSTLDTWWDAFAPTLLSGLDTSTISGAMAGIGADGAPLASLGAAGGGGGATVIHIPVTVQGSVVTERDLVDGVRRGLIQTGRQNGNIFGGLA